MRKLLSFIIALAIIISTVSIFAEGPKIIVSNVNGTSEENFTPIYGQKVTQPNIKITKGSPAYFYIDNSNGNWIKKKGDKWIRVEKSESFIEGTYRYKCQVRIDGKDDKTHVLAKTGLSVVVNEKSWSVGETNIGENYSLVWVYSPEYNIEKPANPPLIFNYTSYYDIKESVINKAITPVDLSSGVSGGTPPYTFEKVSGPKWLTISNVGLISGAPTNVGENSNLEIKLSDSNNNSINITVIVKKTNIDPNSRIVINTMKATTNSKFIPKLNKKADHPYFKIIEGSPAYLDTTNTGRWYKKNTNGKDEKIERYTPFTEGIYYYKCQVSIAAVNGGADYVLPKNGFLMYVDDINWASSEATIKEKSSYLWITSPEYEVKGEKPTKKIITTLKVEADETYIPVYGKEITKPEIKITTEGSPANLKIDKSNGEWYKKTKEGSWEKIISSGNFTEGEYMFVCQICIDGEKSKTNVLDNQVEVYVNKEKWTAENTKFYGDISYAKVNSPHYTVNTPVLVHPDKPTIVINESIVYNGKEQIVNISGFDESKMNIKGNKAKDAGEYVLIVSSKSGWWSDGSTDNVEKKWKIEKANPIYIIPTGLKGEKATNFQV